ncbi:hypothetical protein EMCRGX_G025819, partial [Ephydatia muelleri]
IADSVSSFFNARVSSIGGTFDILLLKSLPIIHFIKTKSAVIASIPPKDVKWGDDTLSLHSIRRKFPQDLNISAQLEELHGLFQLDPLLLIAFIYISPRAAFPSFIKHTPIYLSINWLFHLI